MMTRLTHDPQHGSSLGIAPRTGSHFCLVCACVMMCVCLLPTHRSLAEGDSKIMTTDQKLDLLKRHKDEYAEPKDPTIIDVGEATYLAIDGQGAPGSPEFVASVGAIYGVAYGVMIKSKMAGRDYQVAPLEALWWGTKDDSDFFNEPRESWKWRLLIRTPEYITEANVAEAIAGVAGRGKDTAASRVRLTTLEEGRCVQVLHKGSYADEMATIAAMVAFRDKHKLVPNGYHHEIYLTDPNRTKPEKMRTILRQPVKPQKP